jgi:hypothetical protein
VLSRDLEREWERHASEFSRMWWTRMKRKGAIAELGPCQNQALRGDIEACAEPEPLKQAMRDDVHLVEAALATELRIVSLDTEARDLFQRLQTSVQLVSQISWIDPRDGPRPPGRH